MDERVQAANRPRRVDVRIKVRLKYADQQTFVDRFAQNLSRTGIFIRADDPAPVGSRVHFEYRLSDDSRIMRGVGIVRWSRRPDGATDAEQPPGMGIEFVDVDPQTDELVTRIVATHGEGARAPQARQRRVAVRPITPAAPAVTREEAQLDPEEEDALDALLGGESPGRGSGVTAGCVSHIDDFQVATDVELDAAGSGGDSAAEQAAGATMEGDDLAAQGNEPAEPAFETGGFDAEQDSDGLDINFLDEREDSPLAELGAPEKELEAAEEVIDLDALDAPGAPEEELEAAEEVIGLDALDALDALGAPEKELEAAEEVIGLDALDALDALGAPEEELEAAEEVIGLDALDALGAIDAEPLEAAAPAAACLVIDLSGQDFLATRLDRANGGGGEQYATQCRFAGADGDLRVSAGGVSIPQLTRLLGLRWPSAHARAVARRLGVDAEPGPHGDVWIRIGEGSGAIIDAVAAGVEELLGQLDEIPANSAILVPAGLADEAASALVDRLTRLGLGEPRLVNDAEAALAASGLVLVPGQRALVLTVTPLEARAALLDGGTAAVSLRASLAAGLQEADRQIVERAVVCFLREHELDVADDPSLAELLTEQVARMRREWNGRPDFTLNVAGAQVVIDTAGLARLVAPINERLLLLCDGLLASAGLTAGDLQALVVASEEPPWPGLAEAMESDLGVRPLALASAARARVHGVSLLTSR